MESLTSEFGMGSGVTSPQWSQANMACFDEQKYMVNREEFYPCFNLLGLKLREEKKNKSHDLLVPVS